MAELLYWAEENAWGENRRAALDALLQRFVVIPYDRKLAQTWAETMAQTKAAGYRLEAGDAWIVATALDRSIPLLTHDADQTRFSIAGLTVMSYLTRPTL